MDQEKVGKFISYLRKKNNLTQAELASKYGVTYQAVSKWENGKNLPDLSLIKQMSKDFNIDIEDLLEGEIKEKNNKSNKKYFIIFGIVIILIIIMVIIFINKNNDFEFKTISSNCSNFNISGSMAYNENKSSIYISNINYCGGTDNLEYKKIECTLYETHNNMINKISACNYSGKENIKLEDYLHDVTFTIANYKKICKTYSEENLYLEITATDNDNKITSYKVPLTLKDNCSK